MLIVLGAAAIVILGLVRQLLHARELLDQVQLLLDLHAHESSTPDNDLYEFALERGLAMTDSPLGCFQLVSDDQREVVLTTWQGAKSGPTSDETTAPIGTDGPWADSVRGRRATVVNDAAGARRAPVPGAPELLRRFLIMPVIDQDAVRILFVVANRRRAYSRADERQLELVAIELQRMMAKRRTEQALYESEHHIRTLSGLIPMCAWCKKIRDDDGYWGSVEKYISARTDATVSHGICPECRAKAVRGET